MDKQHQQTALLVIKPRPFAEDEESSILKLAFETLLLPSLQHWWSDVSRQLKTCQLSYLCHHRLPSPGGPVQQDAFRNVQ